MKLGKYLKALALVFAFIALASCQLDVGGDLAPASQEAPAADQNDSRALSASEDFQNEVIYFVFVDRFHNGDTSNDDGNNPATHDAAGWRKYQGGDIQGLIDKLDYLKDMGITAIWITPPIDNTDILDYNNDIGYHGYWGKNFFNIDEHLGTWAKFDELVAKMHNSSYNMKLIIDYAPNHSNPVDTAEYGAIYKTSYNGTGPGATPVSTWKITNYTEDTAGNYFNRNGGIASAPNTDWEWNDPWACRYKNLFNLCDFNQDKSTARDYLVDALEMWVKRGVDGVRLDAVKHMNFSFTQDLTSTIRARVSPKDVFFFGEWMDASAWVTDPKDLNSEGKYFANNSGSSLLDFGYQKLMMSVLTESKKYMDQVRTLKDLSYYLRDRETYWTNTLDQVVFLDNHDAARIMVELDNAGKYGDFAKRRVDLGLALTMTVRGVPCVYYATEQYSANFGQWIYYVNGVQKFADKGTDPYNREKMPSFDQTTGAYKTIKALSALKQTNKALQNGTYTEKWLDNTNGKYIVFERKSGTDVVVVAVNMGSDTTLTVPNLSLANGSYASKLGTDTVNVSGGTATFSLSQNEVVVIASGPVPTYSVSGTVTDKSSNAAIDGATVTIAGNSAVTVGGNFTVTGVPNGTYPVSVTKASYVFDAASVTVSGANVTGLALKGSFDQFVTTYPTMNLRGTFNAWAAKAMVKKANYTWETEVDLTAGTAYSYKYDVAANWVTNFGVSGTAGIAAQNGGNITYTPAASGTYIFKFIDNSKAYSVTLKNPIVPAKPVISSVNSATNNSLTVTWGAASGATNYRISRSLTQTGTYVQVGTTTTATSFKNDYLTPDTTYWYKVIANNSVGDSPVSDPVSGKTTNNTVVAGRFTVIFKTGSNAETVSFPGDPNNWSLTANTLSLGANSSSNIVWNPGITGTTLLRGNSTSAIELKLVTNASWNNQWSFGTWTKSSNITLQDTNRQILIPCTTANEVILTIDVKNLTLTAEVK